MSEIMKSVSGEVATATTANEMNNLIESFNAKMKEQVRKKFNDTVRFLEEQIRCEGQEDKSVSLYSATLEYQSDYLYEWRKFAWEQGKVESSVAIEFYRNNVDMFINVDTMDDYVEELADEYGVDDATLFIQGGCRIYMENPYYDDNVDIVGDSEEEIVKTAKEKRLIDFLMGIESRPSDVEDSAFYIEDKKDALNIGLFEDYSIYIHISKDDKVFSGGAWSEYCMLTKDFLLYAYDILDSRDEILKIWNE